MLLTFDNISIIRRYVIYRSWMQFLTLIERCLWVLALDKGVLLFLCIIVHLSQYFFTRTNRPALLPPARSGYAAGGRWRGDRELGQLEAKFGRTLQTVGQGSLEADLATVTVMVTPLASRLGRRGRGGSESACQ